jgi:protein-tyrosine phosphatase
MPGRYEPFSEAESEILGQGIGCVVCLAPSSEITLKSPAYAAAIKCDGLPWQHLPFAIADYSAPDDREGFLNLSREVADRLHRGERVLIHCGAGVGRTGTLAICVLIALGIEAHQANSIVARAGSTPERQSQRDTIEWIKEEHDGTRDRQI